MTSQEPERNDPSLVKQPRVRPAIIMGEMEWADNDPSIKWTIMRVGGKSQSQHVCDDGCSETPTPVLELTITPDPAAEPVKIALGLYDVTNYLNKVDLAFGGSGFAETAGQQSNGTVTITLAAHLQTGWSDRMRKLCERIDRLNRSNTVWKLPAVLKAIEARQIK